MVAVRSQSGVYDPATKKLVFTITPTAALDEDTYPLAVKAFQKKAVTASEVWQHFIHSVLIGNEEALTILRSCSERKFEQALVQVSGSESTALSDGFSVHGLTPDSIYEILERETPFKR